MDTHAAARPMQWNGLSSAEVQDAAARLAAQKLFEQIE